MNNQNCYDVIVIGSGVAGLAAAIESKTPTTRVLVIEKLSAVGGNSLISDGGIGVVGSDLQVKYGIQDSPELLASDMLTAGKHTNKEALVNCIAHRTNEAYEWTKTIGVQYQDRVDYFGGHSVPRCLSTRNKKGKDMIHAMFQYARTLGVEFGLKQEIKDIVIIDNKASLVSAYHKDKGRIDYTIKHKLILATGGFGSDHALISKYNDKLTAVKSTNLPSAKGDVVTLMERLGARLIGMHDIQCGPWASPKEKGFGLAPLFGDYIALPYGILINPLTNKRFVNERADRSTVSDALMALPYGLAIADFEMVRSSGWDISQLIKKKIVIVCESLEAIAQTFSLDSNGFMQSVKEYNDQFIHKKGDAFHKPLEGLAALSTPPYYVMETVAKIHHTMGGIEINAIAQVIKQDGTHFDNIYAAGECTGGVHGRSRLGSMALMDGLVMGRIAGQQHND